jgi:hypothetical protein
VGERGADRDERRAQVDAQQPVEVIESEALDRGHRCDASTVHQDVDALQLGRGSRDRAGHGVRVGRVRT